MRIQKIISNIAIFQRQLDLVTIRSFHGIMPNQLGFVAFLLVIHQRPVDVRIQLQGFQIVLRKQFRISPTSKRRNLPPNLPVVRLHPRQPLDDRFFPNFVRPFIFLCECRTKGSLSKLPGNPDSLNRFNLFHSAVCLNIFRDHFIHGLRAHVARYNRYRRHTHRNEPQYTSHAKRHLAGSFVGRVLVLLQCLAPPTNATDLITSEPKQKDNPLFAPTYDSAAKSPSGSGNLSPSRATHTYRVGSTKMLSSNAASRPPTITIANGRWESDPMPRDSAAGSRPSVATSMVIMMGRNLRTAPSTAAS